MIGGPFAQVVMQAEKQKEAPDFASQQAAAVVWAYICSRLYCVATLQLSDDWLAETHRVIGHLIADAARQREVHTSATDHAKAVALDTLVDALRKADLAREHGR